MKNLKMYCVTNKVINFVDSTNYNIGWVGQENPPKNYILCNSKDNIFSKEKYYSELTFPILVLEEYDRLYRKTIGLGFVKKEDFGLIKIL